MSLTNEQQILWDQLNDLVEESAEIESKIGVFFRRDFEYAERWYAVFDYHIVSYSGFIKPGALECRGHTFEIDGDGGGPLAMVKWPLNKFFNLGENPLAMHIDPNDVVAIVDKLDGSLITSMWIDGELKLSSMSSFTSEQAVGSLELLKQDAEYYRIVSDLTSQGLCIAFEYIGPDNQHVVDYGENALKVLAVRSLSDGSYIDLWSEKVCDVATQLRPYMTEFYQYDDPVQFVHDVYHWPVSKEGIIIVLKGNRFIKVKADQYCSMHRSLESIENSDRNIVRTFISGAGDDLIARLQTMQQHNKLAKVQDLYDKWIEYTTNAENVAEHFHNDHKGLERKEYMQLVNTRGLTAVQKTMAINKYIGRDNKSDMWTKNIDSFLNTL